MELLGLEWTRPWGFLALALPLAVWWLARRSPTPWLAATGTLALWRAAVRERGAQGERRRGALPPSVGLALAALTLGALALAGPQPAVHGAAAWTVVVDRSPGMHLPHDGAGGPTRLQVALEQAREALGRERAAVHEWVSFTLEGRASVRASDVPQAWLQAPPAPLPEPPWEALDRPGVLWVRASAPSSPPRTAGWSASGGAAVPGAVAASARGRVHWNGSGLDEVAGGAGASYSTAGLPELVESFVRAWGAARGIAQAATPEQALLRIICPACASAGGAAVRAGRDGWSGVGPLAAAEPAQGEQVWLAEPVTGVPLVSARPGLVRLLWRLDESEVDPAAFAVSWARLLDEMLLAPADVVPLAQRLAQGAQSFRAPRASPSERAPAGSAAAALAAAACMCAALALLLPRLAARRRATGALRPRRSAA